METITIKGIKFYKDIATGKYLVQKNSVQSKELTEEQVERIVALLEELL